MKTDCKRNQTFSKLLFCGWNSKETDHEGNMELYFLRSALKTEEIWGRVFMYIIMEI